jgi:hypothetical protein
MGSKALSKNQSELLNEVLKRSPDVIVEPNLIGTAKLSHQDRDRLIEVILAELTATGLMEDDEPNERGLLLEDLIDAINGPVVESEDEP